MLGAGAEGALREWTKECDEKVKSIKCLEHIFTDKLMKEIENIKDNY